ncbi:MAG: ATP-binding cassette domain-containing protein, partial [Pseudomonadota bacterium]
MIAMRNVAKSFGPKNVLADVSLEAPRGQSVVIIGGSGTGKSVTIKSI